MNAVMSEIIDPCTDKPMSEEAIVKLLECRKNVDVRKFPTCWECLRDAGSMRGIWQTELEDNDVLCSYHAKLYLAGGPMRLAEFGVNTGFRLFPRLCIPHELFSSDMYDAIAKECEDREAT